MLIVWILTHYERASSEFPGQAKNYQNADRKQTYFLNFLWPLIMSNEYSRKYDNMTSQPVNISLVNYTRQTRPKRFSRVFSSLSWTFLHLAFLSGTFISQPNVSFHPLPEHFHPNITSLRQEYHNLWRDHPNPKKVLKKNYFNFETRSTKMSG